MSGWKDDDAVTITYRTLCQAQAEAAAAEQERIIEMLEQIKTDLRKKLSEVSGDSQSETYWYSRIQQLDNYITLIKGEK